MKRVFAALVLSAVFSFCFAEIAENVTSAEKYELLQKEGKIQRNNYRENVESVELVPSSKIGDKIKDIDFSTGSPTLIVENLYLLPKIKLNKTAEKVTIGNASVILRSISKMEGLMYYSNGDKKWEVLYHEAYCTDGPKSRKKVPDQTEGSAEGVVQYAYLNDNSLGKINYRVNYFETEDEVAACFENSTGIFIGPVKAVSDKSVQINLEVIDCGDEVLVYMNLKAKFVAVGFLEDRMQKSLKNRMDAIYDWFIEDFNKL